MPAAWLVTPRSFLVDRIMPRCEEVRLAVTKTGGGRVRISVGEQVFAPPPSGGGLKSRLRQLKRPPSFKIDQRLILDLRAGNPGNWAHFLNIHLAFLALAAHTLGINPLGFCVLLPAKMPQYIRVMAQTLKMQCVYTDAQVTGFGVHIDFDDWNCIRGVRNSLLTDPTASPVAARIRDKTLTLQNDSPDRLFLSRKSTRNLTNEEEITQLLSEYGFQTLYMEDLSPEKQFSYLLNAQEVVAIHGAALAPMLYRDSTRPAIKLIELFPVGHLTNVYRAVVAAQAGMWCGVRGYMRKNHIDHIYRLEEPYRQHSLEAFAVDPDSVRFALDRIKIEL
ncbi:MAG: glycosyltransferase family 61 protein [Tateyamaria sp.]|uniref:glycosyltransferase family 61 protein n=1 Tax=Tateyamaria sp. TaxID=1929288 RepID=UPI003290CE89